MLFKMIYYSSAVTNYDIIIIVIILDESKQCE